MDIKTLKKVAFKLFLLFIGIASSPSLNAQTWLKLLPQDKIESHVLTLKDYQNAFKSYLTEKEKKEKKIEKKSEILDENYEKFKRWEWYWETRVNPKTHAFPTVTAYDVYKQFLSTHPRTKVTSDSKWESVGPTTTSGGYNGLGRINCVAFSPLDTNTLYVGSASGGVWKTTDLGIHWSPMGDFNNALGVASLVVGNKGGKDIIYLATGDKDHWDTYSEGVLKSTDGGVTWNKTTLYWQTSWYRMIYKLLLDPNNNTLYAATNVGLLRTTDGANTWTIINNLLFRDIEFQPGSDTWMIGSTFSGQVYYSKDGGENWSQSLNVTDDGGRTELAVTPDSNNVVYAIVSSNRDQGLKGFYKSIDTGVSFREIPDTLNLMGWNCDGSDKGGQGWYDLTIAADPDSAGKVFVGGVNTWYSDNSGKYWRLSNHWSNTCGGRNAVVHADKHCLVFQETTHALFECNDGGIYKSIDGIHWKNIGSGLITSQIYRIGVSANIKGEVIAGLQDNGTKWLNQDVWKDVYGGDGLQCLIDYTNDNVQYGELQRGVLFRTKDHWNYAHPIVKGLPSGAWLTPFVIDPKEHNILYAGFQDVYKTTNQGDIWTKISNFQDILYLGSIAIAPSDHNYIYAATRNKIHQTKDGGVTWTNITGSLPVGSASITYIAVSDSNPARIWVTLGGYNSYGVYETRNSGVTWNNISEGLPNIPIDCIVQNKLSDSTQLYVGTDVGVFVKQSNSKWASYMNSLPNVIVNDLDIQYDSIGGGRLFAGTYGRGLWSSNLFNGFLPQDPIANFRTSNTIPTVNDTIHFRDMSNFNPTEWRWEFKPSTIIYLSGTDSTSENPVVRFNQSGYYSVTLTACGEDTLTKTIPSFILVKKDTLLVSLTANRDKILKGDTTRIFANVTGGYRGYTYSWSSTPQGFSSNAMNPVVTPNNDTTTYTLKVYDADKDFVSDSVIIYWVKKDTLHVNVTSNRRRVFKGDTTQLFADVTGGIGSYTYLWSSDPQGFNSTDQSPIIKPINDTTIYSVEVSDGVNDNKIASIVIYTFNFNTNDSLALVDLYDSCNGQNWINHKNWIKTPVKEWYGLSTSKGRVVGINLGSNNLSGQIPDEIGNLSKLQNLSLANNNLTGLIPSSIGNLVKLQSLNLQMNKLSGSIPYNLGNLTQLQTLNLGSNSLSGHIPDSIGNLVNIKNLFLTANKLSGTIPHEIGNLKSINQLSLSFNNLTGKVPHEVCNLTYLLYMDLSNNSLTSLPDLSSLGNLYYLFVTNNNLTFKDIVPNIRVVKKSFSYSPQAKVDSIQHYLVAPGGSLQLSVSIEGNNDTYQWYRNGNVISGATDSVYKIKNYDESADFGFYNYKIQNKIATDLTLESNNIYMDEKGVTENVALSSNGGRAYTSSEMNFDGEKQLASLINDGFRSTIWHGSIFDNPVWVEIKLSEIYHIDSIGIWWGANDHSFSLYNSTDSINWSWTNERNNGIQKVLPTLYHQVFPVNIDAKYIKLDYIQSYNEFNPTVGEIEVYSTRIPKANFVSDTLKGCNPLKVSFNDNTINGPTFWYWDFGDDSTSTKRNPTHTYQNMGSYSVSLIAKNQFGADTAVKPNYIKAEGIIVTPDTVTLAGIAPNQQTFKIASNVDWTIYGAHDWYRVTPDSGSNSATITVTAEENRPREDRIDTLIIKSDDVSDTVIVKQTTLTGIQNQKLEKSITIYPNPTNSSLNIQFKDLSLKNVSVSLFDNGGKVMVTKYLDQIPTGPIKLNLIDYSAGMYFIQFITNKGTVTKKVIIQK